MHARRRWAFAVALSWATVAASAPPLIVTGRLVDAAGNPPPQTSANLQFQFGRFDASSTFVAASTAETVTTALAQGVFTAQVKYPPLDSFAQPPTVLRLVFNGDAMDIPLGTVPFAAQAERAPSWVNVALSDLTLGSSSCLGWVTPTNGNAFGLRSLGYLLPPDGGCVSSTTPNDELSFGGAVMMPPTKPTVATVQVKLGNMTSAAPPGGLAFRLRAEVRSLSKTQPCVIPDLDFSPRLTGNTALSQNISRTVTARVALVDANQNPCLPASDLVTAYPGGDSFRFQVQRTDINAAIPVELEAVGIEFR